MPPEGCGLFCFFSPMREIERNLRKISADRDRDRERVVTSSPFQVGETAF